MVQDQGSWRMGNSQCLWKMGKMGKMGKSQGAGSGFVGDRAGAGFKGR